MDLGYEFLNTLYLLAVDGVRVLFAVVIGLIVLSSAPKRFNISMNEPLTFRVTVIRFCVGAILLAIYYTVAGPTDPDAEFNFGLR